MFVVSCETFQDAGYCYDIFSAFLEKNEPLCFFSGAYTFNDQAYAILLNGKIEYIFVVRGFEQLAIEVFKEFVPKDIDIMEADRFFQGIDSYYYF